MQHSKLRLIEGDVGDGFDIDMCDGMHDDISTDTKL